MDIQQNSEACLEQIDSVLKTDKAEPSGKAVEVEKTKEISLLSERLKDIIKYNIQVKAVRVSKNTVKDEQMAFK